MDKLEKIIIEKYWWKMHEFTLVLRWAEKAVNEGCNEIDAADYIASQLFKKA